MIRNILLMLTMCAFSGAAVAADSGAVIVSATAADSAAAADKTKAAMESWVTLSYGDVNMDIEDADTDASGWRLNLTFEKAPKGGKVLHGFVIGYIETTADVTSAGPTTSYKIQSLPIYYAPKMLFGKKAFKGFVKGALGLQFSNYQRTGGLGGTLEANDSGLYLGASLGAMYMFNEKFYANVEYEWAYLSNSYYRDGKVQSAMIGLGYKY
jgi:hypothetical protein